MPFTAVRALALRKGFAMRLSLYYQGCQLVDNVTHLPELNHIAGTTYYTLQEAIAFLVSLPDRIERET